MTVAIPTLAAGEPLAECLRSLESQTWSDFEVVVVDNSGVGLARISGTRTRVISNTRNAGFGAAINQAFRSSRAVYLATLNDDAVADPGWLEALVTCAREHPRAGMFASQVRLNKVSLDSAGMLIAADGSSKQRGHGEAPADYTRESPALFPSGSAAMYRREMLEQIGCFDESFFLYCEDTDLGLRAQWAGWECQYVPRAIVDHKYSRSAGAASRLKAYYVERNRLYTVVKNFPLRLLVFVPFGAAARYCWHVFSLIQGRGKAAEFRNAGSSALWLPWLVFRAHAAALIRLPRLIRERRQIRAARRISAREFEKLLSRYSISLRRVAEL